MRLTAVSPAPASSRGAPLAIRLRRDHRRPSRAFAAPRREDRLLRARPDRRARRRRAGPRSLLASPAPRRQAVRTSASPRSCSSRGGVAESHLLLVTARGLLVVRRHARRRHPRDGGHLAGSPVPSSGARRADCRGFAAWARARGRQRYPRASASLAALALLPGGFRPRRAAGGGGAADGAGELRLTTVTLLWTGEAHRRLRAPATLVGGEGFVGGLRRGTARWSRSAQVAHEIAKPAHRHQDPPTCSRRSAESRRATGGGWR